MPKPNWCRSHGCERDTPLSLRRSTIKPDMLVRRHFIMIAPFFVALYAVLMPATAQKSSKLLPFPVDLKLAAAAANARGEPLVLMAGVSGCPWCELLRRNYLGPMSKEGVAAYELVINERSRSLMDFKSQRTNPAAYSDALKIHMSPTLLFFNAQGQEIAPRIEGVASGDFIGSMIDERLSMARERLKTTR